jgi:hypothetical protein
MYYIENTGCGKLTSFFIWHFIFKKGSQLAASCTNNSSEGKFIIEKNIPFLWHAVSCSSYMKRRFRGAYRLHLQGQKSAGQETRVQQMAKPDTIMILITLLIIFKYFINGLLMAHSVTLAGAETLQH